MMNNKKEAKQNPVVKITVEKAVESVSNAVDSGISSYEAIENLQVRHNLSKDAVDLITEKYEALG
jgi:outer membrane protein TolC